jgi:hypothetical protein
MNIWIDKKLLNLINKNKINYLSILFYEKINEVYK